MLNVVVLERNRINNARVSGTLWDPPEKDRLTNLVSGAGLLCLVAFFSLAIQHSS